MNSPEKEKREQETYESFFAGSDQQKSPLRPQPKNEWSEEDERKIVELKTFIAQCNGFNKENRKKAFDMIDALRPEPKAEAYQSVIDKLNSM